MLGRGGYGVVVQAVNRLDGRTYAVKKIAIRAVSPAARGRLMREVSTLARLHHPGIVRYYQARPRPRRPARTAPASAPHPTRPAAPQAWCEAPSGEGPDWLEGSETGDWLTETSQRGAPAAAPLLGVARCGAPAGSPAGLPHVVEASLEGSPSSLFGAAGGSGDTAAGDEARPALRRFSSGSGSSAGDSDGVAEVPAGDAHAHSALREGARPAPAGLPRPHAELRQRVRAAGEPAPGGGLQMLYIQMEFCPRTLRQALDEGPMPEPDAWQVRGGAPARAQTPTAGRAVARALLRRSRHARAGRAAAACGARAHPCAGHHPPRPQARQHLLRQPRRHQARRLWPGQVCVQRGRRRRAGGRAGAAAGRAPAPAPAAPAWPPGRSRCRRHAGPGRAVRGRGRVAGGRAGADAGRAADPAATHRSMASEATGRVGTSFYISPGARAPPAGASRGQAGRLAAALVHAWLRMAPGASEPRANGLCLTRCRDPGRVGALRRADRCAAEAPIAAPCSCSV